MLFIDALESEEEMRALCALPGAAARLPKVWLQRALRFGFCISAERQRYVPDVRLARCCCTSAQGVAPACFEVWVLYIC